MSRALLSVFKLGGSLFDMEDLVPRIVRALSLTKASRKILVVGGGETADNVRAWDRRFALGAANAHWLALRAMTLNAWLFHHLLEREGIPAVVAGTRDTLDAAFPDGQVALLDAAQFVAIEEPGASVALPHNWDATSDSTAVWTAGQLGAVEFTLLKSAPPPSRSIGELSRLGYIDPVFPRLAPRLPKIYALNLRDEAASRVALDP